MLLFSFSHQKGNSQNNSTTKLKYKSDVESKSSIGETTDKPIKTYATNAIDTLIYISGDFVITEIRNSDGSLKKSKIHKSKAHDIDTYNRLSEKDQLENLMMTLTSMKQKLEFVKSDITELELAKTNGWLENTETTIQFIEEEIKKINSNKK